MRRPPRSRLRGQLPGPHNGRMPSDLLMCPPRFYRVAYVINPWMEGNIGRTDGAVATQQWERLRAELARRAAIEYAEPAEGPPDMPFTAKAGLVHLDTCFCPLPGGRVVYYPDAFDHDSLETIRVRVPAEQRCEVDATDALHFACNAVVVGDAYVTNFASPALQERLAGWGFQTVVC